MDSYPSKKINGIYSLGRRTCHNLAFNEQSKSEKYDMLDRSTKDAIKGINPWSKYASVLVILIIIVYSFSYDVTFAIVMIPMYFVVFGMFSLIQTYYKVKDGLLYKWDHGGYFGDAKYFNNFDGSIKTLCNITQIKRVEDIKHLGQIVGLKIWINDYAQDCVKVYTKESKILKNQLKRFNASY